MSQRNEKGTQTGLEIAIIGLACRFPGAKNKEKFWQNLRDGVESISFFSKEELIEAGESAANLDNPAYVRAKGILEGVEYFDAPFFGYSSQEAEVLDPQLRVLHECAWEALEDAGYNPDAYKGLIGTYVGSSHNSFWEALALLAGKGQDMGGEWGVSLYVGRDYLSTHLSYKLNLRGPSMTVQTACSTSLVATHLACRALLMGECDIALAGGISITLPNKVGYLYQPGMIMSSDGHCRAFDAQATGTVFSNGVGVVALKRLKYAIEDGDHIYAVIKGTGVNNDGIEKVGYTAPSVSGQSSLIKKTYQTSRIESESISYIEAHGTGTELGDPIELAALQQAFQTNRQGFCAIGSVKTNIGHLDVAAGAAGLIKTALALEHKQLPPSLHYTSPNPKFNFANSPFYVNTQLQEWNPNSYPRRAGVSSLGIGGTNAHVVLEEAPEQDHATASSRKWQLLLLSARTSHALDEATSRLTEHLQNHPHLSLSDAAYTLQVGRKPFAHRRVAVCSTTEDAVKLLPFARSHSVKHVPQTMVFMFSGQGTQYVQMGRGLYHREPVFRDEMERCLRLLQTITGQDYKTVLYPESSAAEETSTINQTEWTQPLLFVFEYALATLLMQWGIKPQAMIGHSIGEYVAACLAGVFSLEDALRLVVSRGKLMQQMPGGEMVAVPLSQAQLLPLLIPQLSLAAVNSSNSCVVAGSAAEIALFEQRLQEKDIHCVRLHTSHAFHSQLMEPAAAKLAEELLQIQLHPPSLPFISNLSGTWITAKEATDPMYWARHLRQTVHFADGIAELLQKEDVVFLEVGPGATLANFVRQHEMYKEQIVIETVRHVKHVCRDDEFLTNALGALWLHGVKIDWTAYARNTHPRRVSLPTYPFERQRYWIEGNPFQLAARHLAATPSLTKKAQIADWFYIPGWKQEVLATGLHPSEVDTHAYLVFVDEVGVAEALLSRLVSKGAQCIEVREGNGFTKRADRLYELNPANSDEYELLLQDLRAGQRLPDRILHCWGIDAEHCLEQRAITEKVKRRTFDSLLFLAQALGKLSWSDPLKLIVFTNNMQSVTLEEALRPEKRLVVGPVQIIPQEYPYVTSKSVDLAFPLAKPLHTALVERLLQEVEAETTQQFVAYRGLVRFVEAFQTVRLEEALEQRPPLREHGVYLITGGLGGIGLTLAAFLARSVQARLVLVARSQFPDRQDWARWLQTRDEHNRTSHKIRQLQAMEAAGAEVLIFTCDVCDQEQMQAIVAETLARFGVLHGVIHAAGLADGAVIQRRTSAESQEILAPKVQGTLALAAVLKELSLDFLVLCSSISSLLGQYGQVAYCSANAFLDGFALQQAALGATRTLTMNWDAWHEVGMASDAKLGRQKSPGVSELFHHPFLERHSIRQGEDIYSAVWSTQLWVLDEHRIMAHQAALPGTGYVELVLAAVAHRSHRVFPVEIRQLFFLRPLIVEDQQEREVQVILKAIGEHVREFVIQSRTVVRGDELLIHARGEVTFIDVIVPPQQDIAALQARCTERVITMTRAENKAVADEIGFGPRWHSLRQIHYGNGQALARLQLPDEYIADTELYTLHPALLDMSTAFMNTLLHEGVAYAPFSYKRLVVFAPLSTDIYSYVRLSHTQPTAEAMLIYDVTLMNSSGEVLVEIEEYAFRRIGSFDGLADNETHAHITASAAQLHAQDATGDETLLSEEGIHAFLRTLSCSWPQVVISTRDLPALVEYERQTKAKERMALEEESLRPSSRMQQQRPDLGVPFVAPRNAVEQRISRVWQDFLGYAQIGVRDNFFLLGGDSLQAIYLTNKLKKELHVEIPLSDIFSHPTIEALAEKIGLLEKSTYTAIAPAEQKEYYLLSSAQKRIYLLQHMDEQSTGYNITEGFIFEGKIDLERLERGFQQLIARHHILRTSFHLLDEQLVQKVHQTMEFHLSYMEADEEALPQLIKDFIQPFELEWLPLIRGSVIKLGEEKYALLVDMHHIVSDASSHNIIMKEFADLYAGLELEPLQLHYRDFAEWQQQMANSEKIQQQEAYWLDALEDLPVLQLPTDYARPPVQSSEGDMFYFTIDREIREGLRKIERESGTTLFMLLLAAYNVLLMKYTGQEDVVVGSLIAGRSLPELQEMIGPFITTLAVRNRPQQTKRFCDFLLEVRDATLQAFENSDYQFEDLVEKICTERDLSRNPIFDTMLILQNIPDTGSDIQGLHVTPLLISNEQSLLDIRIIANEQDDGIFVKLEYATKLFKRATIERLSSHFVTLLCCITTNPQIILSDVEILAEDERRLLLHQFQGPQIEVPQQTLCQYVERWATTTPNSTAVSCEGENVSYEELNTRANRIARLLRKCGVKPVRCVALLLERSLVMVECILAIWKAGGAYLPLDITYPTQRILEILSAAQVDVLVTESGYVSSELEEQFAGKLVKLDKLAEVIAKEAPTNLDLPCDMAHLAYVIFTSGSTGKPKGAMIEHRGMMNHLYAKIGDLRLAPSSVVAQNASQCFDISVWQFFAALVVGGRTVIYPDTLLLNPEQFLARLQDDQVSILEVVPSYLAVLLDTLQLHGRTLRQLHSLLVTGEEVKYDLVRRWFAGHTAIPLINAYGPTEASDDITHYIMHQLPQEGSIPLGRPVQNTNIYIVDQQMHLCPIGVKGEICVSGVGVGRGYINDASRTQQVFGEDPFVTEKGRRLYKTGDIGCWLPDGTILYFGRKDFQIKIRGYRIELGEIEHRLISHPQVKDAIVVDQLDAQNNTYLCAYYTGEVSLPVDELKAHLGTMLPSYMLPESYVHLEALPLAPNGKIDRKALPQQPLTPGATADYEAPADALEQKLADIWQTLLGQEKISVHANFFELGGHSLKAMRLVQQVYQTFGLQIPLTAVFNAATLRSLAQSLRALPEHGYMHIEQAGHEDYYPTSSAQKRVFFVSQLAGATTVYNIPIILLVEGALNKQQLENASFQLIEHHEALRTSFHLIDGMPVQVIHQSVAFHIPVIKEESEEAVQKIIQDFIRPFDLQQAPLFRVGLIEIAAERHIIMIDMHHIVSDGVSLGVLVKDFMRAYHGDVLPSLRIQYKDFAEWQNRLLASEMMQRQEAYWLDRLAGELPVLRLPTDYARPAVKDFQGATLSTHLHRDVVFGLSQLMSTTNTTLYMVMLAAFYVLLARYCAQEDIVVGSPIAGRSHPDLEPVIGMFVNTLALRNYPVGTKTFQAFLAEVKESVLQAYDHQEYPFDLLVEKLDSAHDISRNPLFDAIFALQNIELEDIRLEQVVVRAYEFENPVAQFDLFLAAAEESKAIKIELIYATSLFKQETARRFLQSYCDILGAILAQPDIPLRDIPLEGDKIAPATVALDEIEFKF